MMTGIGMGLGGIGILLMLIFGGGLIFGAVWLVRTVFSSGREDHSGILTPDRLSPRDILDQRYARGEISKDEYDQIRADLM